MIIINTPGAGGGGLPAKSIILWPLPFDVVTYPQLAGFFLCDGTNGTPDMRGYIPRGTPAGGTVGATAGAATHRHTHVYTVAYSQVEAQACPGGGFWVVDAAWIVGSALTLYESHLPLVRNLNFIQKA